MTFVDLIQGQAVFLDASVLISYFSAEPDTGPACEALLQRIENKELQGYTSATVLGETSHRLMSIEACAAFGWPVRGISGRMRSHPDQVRQLSRYRMALDEIPLYPIQVAPVTGEHVSLAADISTQFGLLTNDSVSIVIMKELGLSALASHDSDFDRIPGITRYSPR